VRSSVPRAASIRDTPCDSFISLLLGLVRQHKLQPEAAMKRLMHSASLLSGVALLCITVFGIRAPAQAAPVTTNGVGRAASVPVQLQNFFPIGVWVAPDYAYATWQARGVNTVVGIGFDLEGSIMQANSLGLHMIREPRSNPADDANEPLLLAWAQPDEPDGIYSQIPYTTLQTQYNAWKTVAPNRPVFINFVGDLNQYDIVTNESGDDWYRKYVQDADWICADKYPVNDGNTNLGVMGQTMDHLQILAGSKPIFAFIESSDIDTTDGHPAPTPEQLRAEMWEVIIHGARGIWFFPEQITPTFLFDTTPTDVANEMTRQNATIAALASVLQGAVDPSGIAATAAAPLDMGWRNAASGAYFIVLNLSSSAQNARTIALSGIGAASSASVFGEARTVPISAATIDDSFAPYAVHIYVVPAPDEIFRDGFD
jgi:Beta-galactosidase